MTNTNSVKINIQRCDELISIYKKDISSLKKIKKTYLEIPTMKAYRNERNLMEAEMDIQIDMIQKCLDDKKKELKMLNNQLKK